MPQVNANRVISAYEVFFKKNGVKRSRLLNTPREVAAYRRQLRDNKRKFLGSRQVNLVELVG
jgi:hypothetical protein